jgi:tRNA dimethylallyltransferase
MTSLPRLVVVLGPTASGKSALGLHLAGALGGEVLVCDSTQVYRHFDIGTAKVPLGERRGIPHHLLDLVEPSEVFTAGEFRRRALEVLADLRQRGKVPVLTAGTGLYLRALLEGLADAPTRSEELRERLRESSERKGPEHLHRLLTRIDPEAAAKIAPRDTQKAIRAIEMRLLTKKSVDEIHRSGRERLEGWEIIKIGLLPPRPALYGRIDERVEAMLRAGWLDEVRDLIASGVAANVKPFQFIGYSQLRDHLAGCLPLADAVAQIQRATRQFAKRQITWFRKECNVHWVDSFGHMPEATASAIQRASPAPRRPI